MEQRLGRESHHQSQINPIEQMRRSFAKVGRQIRVMERSGTIVPSEVLERQKLLDYQLTQTATCWVSHFGFVKGQPMENIASIPPNG